MRTIIVFTLISVMTLTAFAQWSGNTRDQIICYEDNPNLLKLIGSLRMAKSELKMTVLCFLATDTYGINT